MPFHFISPKKILGYSFSLLSILGYGLFVFAAAPTGGYLPAQTLNPNCAPGDTDCFVAPYFINTTGNTAWLGQNAGSGGGSTNYTVFLGTNAGNGATNASNSNFIGQNAGQNAVNANNSNFFGQDAGCNATNADNANFFGKEAGCYATNANNSNFFGYRSGYSATNADHSTFFGDLAGNMASSAYSSSFIGASAGNGATNAYQSNFFGRDAGFGATNASDSSFLGYRAGYQATDATSSFFAGNQAGYQAYGADTSVFIGNQAGFNAGGTPDFLTAASNPFGFAGGSNFIGYQAGYGAEGAAQSTFMGTQAGYFNDGAVGATMIGFQAGKSASPAGYTVLSEVFSMPMLVGNNFGSTIVGTFAGSYNSNSANDVLIGNTAGQDSISIKDSIAIGTSTLVNAETVYNSLFIGQGSGNSIQNAFDSVFNGSGSGKNATNVVSSVLIGSGVAQLSDNINNSVLIGSFVASGQNLGASLTTVAYTPTAGTFMVGEEIRGGSSGFYARVVADSGSVLAINYLFDSFIPGETITGTLSGATATITLVTRGTSTILIGAQSSNNGYQNSIALGANAQNTAANQFMIGSSSSPIDEIRVVQSGGTQCIIDGTGLGCTSDERLKTNITDLSVNILDSLTKVRTVTYNWKANPNGNQMIGFLAQDLEQYFPQLVATNELGQKSVNYANMAPVLTEAIRELSLKLDAIQQSAATVTEHTGLIAWMGDAANGIESFVSRKITTRTLCVADDQGETCVTRDQLNALMGSNATQVVVHSDPIVGTSDESSSASSTSVDSVSSSNLGSSNNETSTPVSGGESVPQESVPDVLEPIQ